MSEQYNSGDNAEAAAPVANENQEHNQQAHQVPLDALQAERAERQKLQDELRVMRDHISLMQASQNSPKQAVKDEFEGLSEDDVLTVKDLKRALGQKEQQFNMTIQEMRMNQKYPDYQQVITDYLPGVLKQNPSLRDTLSNSKDYELAYYLAKNSESYKANHKQMKKHADAERIVQNSQKSGSLSSMGQTSPISQARQYKEMSDSEFKKLSQKNLGYY